MRLRGQWSHCQTGRPRTVLLKDLMFPRSTHLVTCISVLVLFWLLIFHCMNTLPFDSQFISLQTFRLYCFFSIINNASINICAQILEWLYTRLFISWLYIECRIAGLFYNFAFNIFNELPNSFSKQLKHFTINNRSPISL